MLRAFGRPCTVISACRQALSVARRSVNSREFRSPRVGRVYCCSKLDASSDASAPVKAPEGVKEVAQQNGAPQSLPKAGAECENGTISAAVDYPTEKVDEEGKFFPVREPGDFPSTEVSKIREVEEEKEYDPLRDGPLRYLGYANELGEAFAAWLPPGGVPFSYFVAVAYVLFDTRDKGLKAYRTAQRDLTGTEAEQDKSINTGRLTALLAVERAVDTVVWQLLASVIIPGFTIHTVVACVHYLLQSGVHIDDPNLMAPAVASALASISTTMGSSTETVAALVEKSVPTFCGLFTIPFIVHPIDETVHAILNVSMRPALRKYLCENGQGREAGLKICDELCMKTDFPVLSEDTGIIKAFTKSFEE